MAEEFTFTEDQMLAADRLLPSDDVLENEAYLVARGVRPLALIDGHVAAEEVPMLRARTRLQIAAQGSPEAIPFVIAAGYVPGAAVAGYAAHGWVVGLLEWALSDQVPSARCHEILGLLLGYSPQQIAWHQERGRGMQALKPHEEAGRD